MAPAQQKLSGSGRAGDWLVISLALLPGGGSLVFFWPGRPTLIPMNRSFSAALWEKDNGPGSN
ncbi:MAG: hypothetical protein ACK5TK_14220 [Betaproteobacteria bacterium]